MPRVSRRTGCRYSRMYVNNGNLSVFRREASRLYGFSDLIVFKQLLSSPVYLTPFLKRRKIIAMLCAALSAYFTSDLRISFAFLKVAKQLSSG